eukprot:gene9152-biopygen12192
MNNYRCERSVSLLPPVPQSTVPFWGHRTVARAWRGHSAGVARAIGIFFWLGWRGRGAGKARAWRGHVL